MTTTDATPARTTPPPDRWPAPAARARRLGEPGLFALLALPIVAAGILAMLRLGDTEQVRVGDRLRAVAQAKSVDVSRWIDRRREDGRNLLRDERLVDAARDWSVHRDATSRQALLERLRGLMLAGRYADVLAFAPQGDEAWSSASGRPAGTPAAELSSARSRASRAGLAADTGLYARPGAGDLPFGFDLAVPLPAKTPAAPVVLALRSDPQRLLLPLAHDWPGAERGARTLLLRHDDAGEQLFEEPPSAAAPRTARTIHPERRPGVAQLGVDERGVPVIAVATPVAGTDLYLVAEIPQAELQATLAGSLSRIAGAMSLLLVLSGLGTLHVSQRRALRLAGQHADALRRERDALRLLGDIADSSTDAIYARDTGGRYLFVNVALCRMLGRPREQVVGRTLEELHPAGEAAEVRRTDLLAMRGGGAVESEMSAWTTAGPRLYAFKKTALRDAQGDVVGVCGISGDMTERKRAEGQHRQWSLALENTRDAVLVTDAAGRILAVNRAFGRITGFDRAGAIGRRPDILRSGRHGPDFYRRMWSRLGKDGHWRGEVWNRRPDGEVYPALLSISVVRDDALAVVNYVGVLTDLSRQRRSEAHVEQLRLYDPLTNLANRSAITRALERAIAHGDRRGTGVAVLCIDLDGFRTVNDSLGHPAGDELLVSVANRLAMQVRAGDQLARLGGDEFLLVVEDADDPSGPAVLARDLLAAIAAPIPLRGGHEAYVTASIGISVRPAGGRQDATELLRDADAATFRAKETGRNRFCFYTSDLHAEAVEKLALEAALSRAIERDELLLHYQPKVDAATGALSGVEALLRWRHEGQLMPPARFIPVAERGSLILEMGAWVIDHACAQIREWLDAGLPAPKVAVNVATRQVTAGGLDRVVASALERHRVPARLLELEITESTLLAQPEETVQLLRRIRSLGVTLSLDDFGTGYSSLRYLQQLPIDGLKIDQSFIRTLGEGADGAAIADAVIDLGHRLRLEVIAEGVETPAQRDYLAARGCDRLQGYLFARPLPAGEIVAWLEAPVLA